MNRHDMSAAKATSLKRPSSNPLRTCRENDR